MVRSDGRYWCRCGYQAPRQYRPGSPKAKQAVDQHVQQSYGTLVARVDAVSWQRGGVMWTIKGPLAKQKLRSATGIVGNTGTIVFTGWGP